jgi:hypothetical protein
MNNKLFRFFKKRRDIFMLIVVFSVWLYLTINIKLIDNNGDDCIIADGILALCVICLLYLLTIFIRTYVIPWIRTAYKDYKNA